MTRILTALLGLLLAADAFAQTPTQPVYVRQAKNAATIVFDNSAVTSGPATSTRIFETSAFSSAIINLVQVSGGCFSDNLSWEIQKLNGYLKFSWTYGGTTLTINALSSPTSTGTYTTMFGVAQNGSRDVISVQNTCVFDMYVTLIPFPGSVVSTGDRQNQSSLGDPEELWPVVVGGISSDETTVQVMEIGSSGGVVVEVPSGAATAIAPNSITTVETVYSFDGTKRVTLQNNGTGAMLCAVTSNAALAVDSTNYDFSLAASSAVNDGTGGSITLPYIPLTAYYLRCVALSGTAIAAGFAHL